MSMSFEQLHQIVIFPAKPGLISINAQMTTTFIEYFNCILLLMCFYLSMIFMQDSYL